MLRRARRRDGVAERYIRGRNKLASPYRYELEIDPSVWFLEDEGYELAVFHSHPETEPRRRGPTGSWPASGSAGRS